MLVLSRKIGEMITVGNSVTVTVLSYDRGVVRLGIEAPRNISVHRKEIHDKIISMNRQAARTGIETLKNILSNKPVDLADIDKEFVKPNTLVFKRKSIEE